MELNVYYFLRDYIANELNKGRSEKELRVEINEFIDAVFSDKKIPEIQLEVGKDDEADDSKTSVRNMRNTFNYGLLLCGKGDIASRADRRQIEI